MELRERGGGGLSTQKKKEKRGRGFFALIGGRGEWGLGGKEGSIILLRGWSDILHWKGAELSAQRGGIFHSLVKEGGEEKEGTYSPRSKWGKRKSLGGGRQSYFP